MQHLCGINKTKIPPDHRVSAEQHSRPKHASAVARNCGCYRIAGALPKCGMDLLIYCWVTFLHIMWLLHQNQNIIWPWHKDSPWPASTGNFTKAGRGRDLRPSASFKRVISTTCSHPDFTAGMMFISRGLINKMLTSVVLILANIRN